MNAVATAPTRLAKAKTTFNQNILLPTLSDDSEFNLS
jgi:hypothetical protein